MGRDAKLAKPRFARGVRCFAVLLDGEIAGYGWLSTRAEWIGEIQLEIRPGKDEAYIWNCVTLTAHRRKGVFRSLVVGIAKAARATGVKRLWIGSVAIPGESALAPSGFRAALRFHAFELAGVQVMTMSRLDPVLGTEALRVLSSRSNLLIRGSVRRRH